jgi:hypothetical protein
MPAASYSSGVFEHAEFNVAHRNDIRGVSPVPRHESQSQSGQRALPIIDRLFGALVQVPPSAWLFV